MTNLLEFLSEPGTLSLLIPCIICLYGFGLFAWWWRRVGSATEVYAYVTFLYLTGSIPLGLGVLQRWSYYNALEFHEYYIHSLWYGFRTIPLGVTLLLIVGRMTQRVLRTKQYEMGKKKERREVPCPLCESNGDSANHLRH